MGVCFPWFRHYLKASFLFSTLSLPMKVIWPLPYICQWLSRLANLFSELQTPYRPGCQYTFHTEKNVKILVTFSPYVFLMWEIAYNCSGQISYKCLVNSISLTLISKLSWNSLIIICSDNSIKTTSFLLDCYHSCRTTWITELVPELLYLFWHLKGSPQPWHFTLWLFSILHPEESPKKVN